MAFLTIAGITVPVAPTGASESAPELVGSDSRSYAGAFRSTVRAEKRGWVFTTKPISRTLAESLRSACALGALVTCTGDALGGLSYTCRVTIGQVGYVKVASGTPGGAGGFLCTVPLTLRQV